MSVKTESPAARERRLQRARDYSRYWLSIPGNKKKHADYYRQWYAKNGRNRPADYVEAAEEWTKRHPLARKAIRMVGVAVRTGKMVKPNTCTKCARKTRLCGHHNDYTKPLEVEWLCSSCHKLRHLQIT